MARLGNEETVQGPAARPTSGDPVCSVAATQPAHSELGVGFLDDRLAQHWDGGEPLRPERTVSGMIGAFRPQDIPDDAWGRVQDLVKTAVLTAGPPHPLLPITR